MSALITNDQLKDFLQKKYDLQGNLTQLPGEIDLNYHLKLSSGHSYTIKIAHEKENRQHLEMQNAIMDHLHLKMLNLVLPVIQKNKNGDSISEIIDSAGNKRFLRVLTWVSGKIYAHSLPKSSHLLTSVGQACAEMVNNLQDFDHPGAHREYKWDLAKAEWIKDYFNLFQGSQKEWVTYFFELFQEIQPVYKTLRKNVIYNDANDYNIIVSEESFPGKVKGFIDFGDVMYTQVINELAIAIAYGIMDKEQPLEAACDIIRGFHSIYPLQEKEIEVLFPLIAARLLVSLTVSSINRSENPENEYLLISQQPAWEALEKWRNIQPNLALYAFRHACGWLPHPQQKAFQAWANDNRALIFPIVNFSGQNLTKLDLGIGSLDLGNNNNFDNIQNFEVTIKRMLEESNASIGIGGYGEIRPVYTTDAYLIKGNSGPQWRTVHLGIDIWNQVGTPVYAPLDGEIHSFQNNIGERNYGPTIILKHTISEKLTFYTLYGHLSISSLAGLKKGAPVNRGQQIASIGPAPENGNWPPHLHFQIMLDMLDNEGDFPGVSFPEEKDLWLSICPNGASFLKTKDTFLPSNTIEKDEILNIRQKKLGKSLSISYQNPLHILRGYKQYLYDYTGRRFLDTVNNVAHVGHEHPKVVLAAQKQAGVLNTNTRYLHPNIIHFAEQLLDTFPPELSVVHFVNSGSEANELALRMVRTCTGQRDMVAVEVGYHGNTTGCVDISSYKFDGKGGRGAPEHVQVVPIPDTYRGQYRDLKTAGPQYAKHIQEAIQKIQAKDRNVGGFICESILSCGGQIVLPPNYLKEAFNYIRAEGGLCIADEVQVGFGRVGDKFWGFELQDVIPDIVTVGKPIGNGHPLAAVITTKEVANKFANGMEYFSTFGGNPVSCAIGNAVLKVVQEEGLQEHAKNVGHYLSENLNHLKTKYPIIGDVRGPGLFLGFELVKDTETLTPAAEQANYLANRMRAHGILMSTDGPYYNVLKIKPPLCFDKKNVDFLIETLDTVLKEDFLQL